LDIAKKAHVTCPKGMLQIVESLRDITKHCPKTTVDRRSIKKPISLTLEGMDMVSGGDNKTSDGILSSGK
jgi:hypothetical protein